MTRQRKTFSAEHRALAAQMVREGASTRLVQEGLGLNGSSAQILVTQVRHELASQGVTCPCGQPIDHPRSCGARQGKAGRRTAFRFTSATAALMTSSRRRRISKLARAGFGCAAICRKTGETVWRVDQLIAELRAAGETPAKCVGCDNPYNHRGPCLVPDRCDCGRWRHHRGPCRSKTPQKTVKNGDKPPNIDPALRQAAMARYRDGDSISRISSATGIPWSQVQRLISYWRARSHYELKPCICGRPGRHPGGCIKNTPGAVGKIEKARIVDAIRAGEMPHRIAARLGLHMQTVLRHSAAVRDELFASGVTCACGRPIGHAHWCSAKWDAYDQPRGRRPFPELRESQAVEALVRGDVAADVAAAVGVGVDSIWRLRRDLSASQRAERTRAIRARIARQGRGGGNEIMDRIKAAVSRRIDPLVRDDVVGELYLAVVEGRVEVEQITAVVRSFVSRGLSQWQSAYGPRSLDANISSDGDRTLGDLIGDDTAAQTIDEIEIGQPPP